MSFILMSFIFFTALVAIISWYLTKDNNLSTESGYFLGGRSLGATVIAGSMMLTNLSTEQMIGLNAQAFKSGLAVIAWEAGASIAIIVLALYFLPKYLQGSITTIPEFLEERYDKTVRNIVSIFFLLTLGIAFLPTVLYSGSLAMMKLFDISTLFNISEHSAIVLTVWLIGIIGSIYAIFGGLKAVAISDTLNGVGLIIGGLLIPILGFMYLGNNNLIKGIIYIYKNTPEKLNAIGNKNSQVPFGTAITGMRIIALYYWCTNQAIIQRALGAKSLKEGQKGVLLTALLKIIIAPLILVIPGIIAYNIFDDTFKGDIIYPILVNKLLPKYLIGFFGAVLFGAVLSSFNSALNSASTIFSLNIYKPLFNKTSSEKHLIKVSKYFGTVLAIFSMLVAPLVAKSTGGLFEFIQKVAGLFSVPILIIVLVGMFSKKASALSAKISMFFFVTVYGYTQFITSVKFHFLYIIGALFIICLLLIYIIDKITPSKKIYTLPVRSDVPIEPWKYRYTASTIILSILIWIYTIFSDFGILNKENTLNRFLIITFLFVTTTSLICLYMRKLEREQEEKKNYILNEAKE